MSKSIDPGSQIFARTGIITSAGQILAAYVDRRCIVVQNLGTNPLYVKFGASASTVDFDFILRGGAVDDDGLGAIMSFDVFSYTGVVSVAGSGVRCTATDF